MRPASVSLCVVLLLIVPGAWAQTTSGTSTTGTSLADQQPADNVRGGAVQARAPGLSVQAALARHRERSDLRLSAQRSHETYLLAPESDATSSSSSSLAGSLSNLIGSFLNSGLTGTLSNLTGGTTGTTSTGDGNTSGLPDEVIQMLTAFGIDVKDLNLSSREDPSATQATSSTEESKTSTRSQTTTPTTTTTQEERKFVVRWADAMLSTVFTALTVGFQSSAFIDVLEDLLRPIINPEADSSSTDGATDGQSSDGSSSDGGSSSI